MNYKRITLGALAGTLTFFFSGIFLYDVVFIKFIEKHLGTAINIVKLPPATWAIVTSNCCWGLLLSIILLQWTNSTNTRSAIQHSFITGLLTAVFMDFSFFGTTNAMDIYMTLVDVFIITVTTVLSGMVIVLVDQKWGRTLK